MNSRYLRLVAAILSLLLFAFSGFAQQTKKRWHAASLDGTSGLFKVWDAEALRQGETNWTFGWDQFQRDPGQLTIGELPVGAAVGLFDRLEVFGGLDLQRHITADNIAFYRVSPLSTPRPATTPTGFTYFSYDAPFIDVPESTGLSDIHLGLKFNMMSERRGDPVSLALVGLGVFPGQLETAGLNRGLSNGAFKGGLSFLVSKTAAEFMRFHVNVGYNYVTDPAVGDAHLADLKNEIIYRVGAEFPPNTRYRIIAELDAARLGYYGSGPLTQNPRNPMDLIFGLRVYPKEWLSFGAGYQASLDHIDDNDFTGALKGGYNGFVVQGTLATRKNDPPTVACAVAKQTILQTESTTIRANAVDPDGDVLTYTWSATGGKLSGTGDTATFDATDVAPGKYTVTATVADKKHQATCTTEITVLKRNYPPTAKLEPPSATVTQGDGVNFRCLASDANNDPLTYTWTVDGQRLAATGPQIAFGTEGRKPGNYKVNCNVTDGEASADAASNVTVNERIIPNQPPTIECLTTTLDVASGGSIELRARAADPDNDKLTYSWSSTGGTVSGTGETAVFNASGVRAGNYTVTTTVDDGRGGKASCSMMVYVSELISVTKENCGYFTPGGARVDNCAKAILDDLAVRMKNDPKLRANIIGYTDGSRSEKSRKTLGERRAKNVAAYLEKQGVEASRMMITNGGANKPVGDDKTAAGRKLNRRVEIELTAR
jgi:outer membrane protein OmpA-like peptidoglycan-associated protein